MCLMVAGCLFLVSAADLFAVTYVVRKGDTLTRIADRHGLTASKLATANDISLKEVIRPGQQLDIPEATSTAPKPARERTVIVLRNDNLTLIARRNGVHVHDLANANGISLKDPIYPGQRLKVPSGPVAAPVPDLSSSVQRAIDRAPMRTGRWKNIVIHHSATAMGTIKGMDSAHRRRGMENGLAYHFVIGNGRGMKDGEVAVCNRWTKQLHGGHLKSESLNEISLGICLVGNFEETTPTRKQIDSLDALLESLLKRCNLKIRSIKTHKQMHRNHTQCPGKRFDLKAVTRRIDL